MSPTLHAITRARYWIVVILRIIAAFLFAYTAMLLWRILSDYAMYEFFERGTGGSHKLITFVAFEVVSGPAATAAAGYAAVRYGPALSRWLAPLPRTGCPECGYQAAAGALRCPECGAPLAH